MILGDPDNEDATQSTNPLELETAHSFGEDLSKIDDTSPTPEQTHVTSNICNNHTTHNALNLSVVSGVPGSGNTFVATKCAVKLKSSGRNVVVAASTWAAATRLSAHAQTVHSAS